MRSHTHKARARSALLVSRARRMLHAPTPSEEALWLALRDGALGVAFKRQVVLGGRSIVDFFAPSVGLVVEVDGGVHRSSAAADRRRDERLRRRGYRVVRVAASLVLRDVEAALAVVQGAIGQPPRVLEQERDSRFPRCVFEPPRRRVRDRDRWNVSSDGNAVQPRQHFNPVDCAQRKPEARLDHLDGELLA